MQPLFTESQCNFEVAYTLSHKYARISLRLLKLLETDDTCHRSPLFKRIQGEVKHLNELSRKAHKDSKRYYKQYEMSVNIADMPQSKTKISLKRPRSDSNVTVKDGKPLHDTRYNPNKTRTVGTQTSDPRNFRNQSQFQTSINFWASEVDDLRRDITRIKQLLVKFEHILVTNQTKQLEFLQRYFDRQSEQLVACQVAFQQNVDRDEELRTTLCESADPWGGC